MYAGPRRQFVLGTEALSLAVEIAIHGAVSKTSPFKLELQRLMSLIYLKRNLHAAIRSNKHLLQLGQESTPKYKRNRTQQNIFVFELSATVRQLLRFRSCSGNRASRAVPSTADICHEF